MGKKYSRYISCILILSIMSSVLLTGCSKTFKNGRAATIICDDDEPWYVSETKRIDGEIGQYIYYSGFYNGKLYSIAYLSSYNGIGNDYEIFSYDTEGNIVESTVISSIEELNCSGDLSSYCNLEAACFASGYILFGVENYTDDFKYEYLYNVENHSVIPFSTSEISYGSVSESYYFISYNEFYHAYYEPGDGTVYIDHVIDGEVIDTVDLSELIDSEYGFPSYPSLFFEDNKLQFTVVNKGSEGSYNYQGYIYLYDAETNKVSRYYELSDDFGGRRLHSVDGEFVYKTDGLYMKSGEDSWDCVVPFDRCDVVSSYLVDSYITKYTDDELDFIYFNYDGNCIQPYFTRITKIDSNPHVGKELIKAAFIDNVSMDIEQAIYDFNSENERYYISLDHRYDASIFELEYGYDEEENILLDEAELQKEIVADFKSGESADIYFGMSSHYLLQNENYLEDLSFMAEKDFSSKSYLTNIFEASKSLDGKLYSMPIGYIIEGLSIENNLIDTKGFTYDSYIDVVNNDFEGIDPLNYNFDKTEYFMTLFMNQPQLFFDKKGKFNVGGDSFAVLAQYCKENVPDDFDRSFSYVYGDSNSMDYDTFEKYSNMYYGVSGIISYLDSINYGGDKNMLAGLPSERGDGLVANIIDSVSISVDSGSKEGCWDFIKYVLSTPVQSKLNYEIPINLDAIDERARKDIDAFNTTEDDYTDYYFYRLSTRDVTSLDYDVISDYIDVLSDVKHTVYYDPEIIYIVEQEISDYFDGQTSLDQAIGSIEDRTNKVYDDRG